MVGASCMSAFLSSSYSTITFLYLIYLCRFVRLVNGNNGSITKAAASLLKSSTIRPLPSMRKKNYFRIQ
ncbi:hypothetical protein BCV72DRAFT_20407 [Rhizopus microsporus var. microsporus]|uniref:Uncharacterized protein n=1 Tax=Rhizopus microsporus var. microsporus TaxID=86635 RepID=A0A1X0QWK3_RHIZD|nr:hypothetical protein BCV72DRAFT_20407 [Rhizopus microsporus var. microsporus]